MTKQPEPIKDKTMAEPIKNSDSRSDRISARNLDRIPPRSSMKSIHPLGMRVVVRLRKEAAQTNTGLYLPDGAKEATQQSVLGEVVEVASAIELDEIGEEEEVNVSGIPEGALVLLPKTAGLPIPWDEDLRIVDTRDVLAIVTEVEVS